MTGITNGMEVHITKSIAETGEKSMAGRAKMQKLSPEEAEFAAEHHELIVHFLSSRHLPEVDYYDIAALGFMRAVKNWFERPDLHRYAFSTLAWHAMSNRIWNSKRMAKKYPTFSLDNILPGTNSLTYLDLVPDRTMSVEDQICIRETISEAAGGGQLVA